MTDQRAPIDAGFLHVVVRCPRCGERADVTMYLGAVLKVTEDGSQLRAAMKSKPVDHVCGQLRLEDVIDADADLELDYAQRAAGEAVRRA